MERSACIRGISIRNVCEVTYMYSVHVYIFLCIKSKYLLFDIVL